jgi:dihydrofolate reductase
MELSVNTFVSLDGVMQGPGGAAEDTTGGFGRGGWQVPYADQDMGRIVEQDWFAKADAFLLGRTTYQLMYPYWSTVTDPQNQIATALNALPKFVASRSMTEPAAEWRDTTTVVSGDLVEEIRKLKQRPGRELQIHGSWQLARAVHEAGLADVYRLLVFPVAVCAGKRLFDDASTPTSFKVESAETTSAGTMSLTLRPSPFAAGDFIVEDGRESVA